SLTVFDDLSYDQGPLVATSISGVKFYRENVLDWSDNLKEAISKADVIIPLAALVGAPLCDKYPELTKNLNLKWIERLIPLLREDQLVVFPNTNSSYGTVEGICTEETPTNPISLYAETKQKAEELLLSQHKNSIIFR